MRIIVPVFRKLFKDVLWGIIENGLPAMINNTPAGVRRPQKTQAGEGITCCLTTPLLSLVLADPLN